MDNTKEINPALLAKLGISQSQIRQGKDTKRPMPEWWNDIQLQAKEKIYRILSMDEDWRIPKATISTVFVNYNIVGSWRTTTRQLGNCAYYKKVIRINLGYKYHKNDDQAKAQALDTLIHEYVHAILFEHYGKSQNHNHRFVFYLRLLTGKTYRKGK